MYIKIQKLLKEWKMGEREVKQICDSSWQVEDHAVLKVYQDVNMLQRNMKILEILEDMEMPVGAVIRTKDGRSYVTADGDYYILTKKLRGNHIADISKNIEIASEMGRALGKLHKAFKECEALGDFWNNSLLEEMNGWIRAVFVKNSWKCIDESEFNDTVKNLEKLYRILPVQLIHRDVHFGNFLFHEGRFSGYIDFDLSQRNIRIFDLCYFMLGLLSERETFHISQEQWFDAFRYFFDGYEYECELLAEEKQAVPYVMESIELLLAAWFLKRNDRKCAEDTIKIYEFVKKNVRNTEKGIV